MIAAKRADGIRREMSETSRIPKVLRGHDLVNLAKRADFETGTDEEYLLAFLTRYGTWAGRYPLPISNMGHTLTGKLSDGNFYVMAAHNPDRVDTFINFARCAYSWARDIVEPSDATAQQTETD